MGVDEDRHFADFERTLREQAEATIQSRAHT
jgi:hypothetical protein